jgi:hypothetical protein
MAAHQNTGHSRIYHGEGFHFITWIAVNCVAWLERRRRLVPLLLVQTLFDHPLKLTELLSIGSTQNGHLKK